MKIEIKRGIENTEKSNFSEKLKFELSKIDFNLNEEHHNHLK
jgi:hypothetical protein